MSVLDSKSDEFLLDDKDLIVRVTKDSGPGGQHRNKTSSCVIIKHIPTGLEAKSASKSQSYNRVEALRVLTNRVSEFYRKERGEEKNSKRRSQIGDGGRAEKIRTYRFKDERLVDHRSGKTFDLKLFMSGKLDRLS